MTKAAMPYPKGDLRRMLSVLSAIDSAAGATVAQVSTVTGLSRQTVTDLIHSAAQQAGVRIRKSGSTYQIVDWGPVIRKAGAVLALSGELEGRAIEE
ncbi:conserved hypothetical protein [Paraburkholderia tropica]|uniref:helix-turn-helix domain-containing protein n=1 Tax=Paraburkholderia tropica TaxID=92647 RepID=UPI001CABB32C|nr:helix-turn-helix domain-containing protein [Paraburkholderia tropica]CAG9235646.1 conserved hypothetical protein [Paraburkholderia tropica]